MKMEIKKLILCAAVSLILLPAEEVLGAEQTASVMIPVVQQFETRNKLPDKRNQTFRYELIREEQDAPMPDESDGDRYAFDMKGSEKKEIGPITYTRTGIWHYTLKQSVQKEEKDYDYDKQTYAISVYVENLADGGLGVQMIVTNKEPCQISVCGLHCWRCPAWWMEKQCIRNDRLDKPIGEEEKIYIRDAKAS